jgi:hypothetical protein
MRKLSVILLACACLASSAIPAIASTVNLQGVLERPVELNQARFITNQGVLEFFMDSDEFGGVLGGRVALLASIFNNSISTPLRSVSFVIKSNFFDLPVVLPDMAIEYEEPQTGNIKYLKVTAADFTRTQSDKFGFSTWSYDIGAKIGQFTNVRRVAIGGQGILKPSTKMRCLMQEIKFVDALNRPLTNIDVTQPKTIAQNSDPLINLLKGTK